MAKYNEPAFPRSRTLDSGTPCWEQDGMTLRDYFATAALQGLLASAPIHESITFSKPLWAKNVYAWADAMMAERIKP